MRNLLPVLTVVAAIFVIWYAGAVGLNAAWAKDKAERAGVTLTFKELVADTWSQDKPKLPAPHQVGAEIWKTTGAMVAKGRAFSKRSLIYHSWVTFSSTALGFVLGTALGTAAGHRDCLQPNHGHERDALGDRQSRPFRSLRLHR